VPSVSVLASYNRSTADITILKNYINGYTALEVRYQYMISEIVMLRLFSVLESTISEVAFKLACGASYRSGRIPISHKQCKSIQDAFINMLSHNRKKAYQFLKWTKASFVRDSIEHVLDISDSFYSNVQIHSNLIDEMRIVRNHIAHHTSSTKKEYIILLQKLYGGNPRLTMGAFLTSTNRNTIPNIDRYIRTTKIILNDITNG